jgi:hypothetical protein
MRHSTAPSASHESKPDEIRFAYEATLNLAAFPTVLALGLGDDLAQLALSLRFSQEPIPSVEVAALRVMAGVNQELERLAGPETWEPPPRGRWPEQPRECPVAGRAPSWTERGWWRSQYRQVCELRAAVVLAREAVADIATLRRAKEIQLLATANEPLAVCGGRPAYDVNVVLDHLLTDTSFSPPRHALYGCGRIFRDHDRATAHMFSHWCRSCNSKGMSRRFQEQMFDDAKREALAGQRVTNSRQF